MPTTRTAPAPCPPESTDPALWPLTFTTPSTTEVWTDESHVTGVGEGPAGTTVSAHLTQQGRCGLPGTHPGELVTELMSVERAGASAAPRGGPAGPRWPQGGGPPTQQTQHRPQGGVPGPGSTFSANTPEQLGRTCPEQCPSSCVLCGGRTPWFWSAPLPPAPLPPSPPLPPPYPLTRARALCSPRFSPRSPHRAGRHCPLVDSPGGRTQRQWRRMGGGAPGSWTFPSPVGLGGGLGCQGRRSNHLIINWPPTARGRLPPWTAGRTRLGAPGRPPGGLGAGRLCPGHCGSKWRFSPSLCPI